MDTSKRPTECVRAARPQGACRGCSRITWIPHRTVYHPRGRCFTMRSNSACASLGIEVSRISLVTPANPFDHCSTLYARSDMLGIATDSRDKRQPLGRVAELDQRTTLRIMSAPGGCGRRAPKEVFGFLPIANILESARGEREPPVGMSTTDQALSAEGQYPVVDAAGGLERADEPCRL
jgi:hypothetical protein